MGLLEISRKLIDILYVKNVLKVGVFFSAYYTCINTIADFYIVIEKSMEPALSGGDIVVIKPVNSVLGIQFGELKVVLIKLIRF